MFKQLLKQKCDTYYNLINTQTKCFFKKFADAADNEFFDKAFLFLPLDLRGAFQLCKQSGVVEKCCSLTLCFRKWKVNDMVPSLSAPSRTQAITILWMPPKVPNCVLLNSNKSAKDPSQDSKCTDLNSHAHGSSLMANWGHATADLIPSAQPKSDSTPTTGNVSQLIPILGVFNENNDPPSDTTVGNDPLFPSVINDVSSIP